MQERGNYAEDTALQDRRRGQAHPRPRRTTTARRVLRERRDDPRRAVGAPAREGSDRIGGAQGDHGAAAAEGPGRGARRDTASRACARRFLMPDADTESRVVRGHPRAPAADAGLRLHRLQARQPHAPRRRSACRPSASQTFEAYLDYLQVHQEEFEALFNTILINVTSFFRDPDVWDYLDATCCRRCSAERVRVLPHPRLERRVRVRPGGLHASRCCWRSSSASTGSRERVKIYATDVDDEALAQARQRDLPRATDGGCPAGAAREVLRRDRRRTLRSTVNCGASVIFGRHRSDPGRADLARRLAAVPQHADVLQRRGAGAHPEPLCILAESERRSCCSAAPRCCSATRRCSCP